MSNDAARAAELERQIATVEKRVATRQAELKEKQQKWLDYEGGVLRTAIGNDLLKGAQPPLPRQKRLVIVRRSGHPANGPNEISWEEYESLSCDQARVPEYIRSRDMRPES